MDTKHTPGPRFLADMNEPGEQHVSYGSPNAENGAVFTGPDRVANAMLDAAAPELLEACKAALAAVGLHQFPEGEGPLPKQLRAAIAKAEGGAA